MAFKITDMDNENRYIFAYNASGVADSLRITITPQQVDSSVIAGVTLDKKQVKKLIKELKKWLRNKENK